MQNGENQARGGRGSMGSQISAGFNGRGPLGVARKAMKLEDNSADTVEWQAPHAPQWAPHWH